MTCLPVRKTAAWLTTIEPGKVKSPQVRARVIQYQNECDDALWHYWNEGIAVNPRALYSVSPGDVLTGEEAEALRLMLTTAVDRLPKHKRAAAMVKGWSKLKAHFHVSYRQIPRSEFTEALSIVARHTAEWDLVDEAPSSGALNEQVARMVRQVEGPNGTPVEVFMPLVNAVLSKCGLRSPVSRAQQEAITTRLDRLGMLFHPMSDQAADLVGILRAPAWPLPCGWDAGTRLYGDSAGASAGLIKGRYGALQPAQEPIAPVGLRKPGAAGPDVVDEAVHGVPPRRNVAGRSPSRAQVQRAL